MEWLVEKATEIGVHSIKFFVATRTERKNLNTEKLRNISISAIKQSGRCWLPELSEPLPIRDILKIDLPEKFIASFSDKNQVNSLQLKDSKPCCIMVGPEGDFTEDELNQAFQCGFKSVKLSNFTLRSETAGLIAVHELLRSN